MDMDSVSAVAELGQINEMFRRRNGCDLKGFWMEVLKESKEPSPVPRFLKPTDWESDNGTP